MKALEFIEASYYISVTFFVWICSVSMVQGTSSIKRFLNSSPNMNFSEAMLAWFSTILGAGGLLNWEHPSICSWDLPKTQASLCSCYFIPANWQVLNFLDINPLPPAESAGFCEAYFDSKWAVFPFDLNNYSYSPLPWLESLNCMHFISMPGVRGET